MTWRKIRSFVFLVFFFSSIVLALFVDFDKAGYQVALICLACWVFSNSLFVGQNVFQAFKEAGSRG